MGVSRALYEQITKLKADNERLRALIKSGEWAGQRNGSPCCRFCRTSENDAFHYKDCPAFTRNGEVK